MTLRILFLTISALVFSGPSLTRADEVSTAKQGLEPLVKECKRTFQSGCSLVYQAYRDLNQNARTADKSSASPIAVVAAAAAPPTKSSSRAPSPSAAASQPPPPLPSAPPPVLFHPAFPPQSQTEGLCIQSPGNALFIRADPLDDFHYALEYNPTLGAADAKGASVNYTDDRVAGKQTATIDGRVSYLLLGELCNPLPDPTHPYGNYDAPFWGGLAIAPFFSSNGTWNEPLPTKLSNSTLKAGADFMGDIVGPRKSPLEETYLYASPYYQTDYQNRAQIEGAVFAVEPVVPDLFLGSSSPTPYYAFFWQLRGEVDPIHVTQSGLTKLSVGNHVWLGEAVNANLALFPAGQPMSPNPFIQNFVVGRFSLIGGAQNYYDAETGAKANYYSAILQYKLGACKKTTGANATDVNATDACSITGSSSLSFEYDTGIEKDTLVKTNQYLVKLGFAY